MKIDTAYLAHLKTLDQNATHGPWDSWHNSSNVGVRSEPEGCRIYYENLEMGVLPETHDRQRADASFIAE